MRRIALLILLFSLFTALVVARPFNTPIIDGTITGDGIDWEADELKVDDPPVGADWGPNQIEQLWVTYDSLALYIGVNYEVLDNAMIVYLVAGTGQGAQDVSGIDWYARNFIFEEGILADHLIANWNGGDLGIRRIPDPATTEDITTLCENANLTQGMTFFRNGEIRIPWDVIYGGDPGTVPAGTSVDVVALIAGGDGWNGPSSAPWNPGMDGSGSQTLLANRHTIYVDLNGDGIPDSGEGTISGDITLDDQDDVTTVASVELFSEFNDMRIDSTATAPGGGIYLFEKLTDGSYRVEASAPGYARIKQPGVVVEDGANVTGVDILLTRAGKITGNIIYADGPGIEGSVAAYDSVTGVLAGDGEQDIPPAGGPFEIQVPDGTYYVIAEGLGYVSDTVSVVIADSDSMHVGDISLSSVKATKLVLIDQLGNELESVNTTVSFPDSGIFFYASALIEARDDLGRRDWYDVDGYLQQVDLLATKLNNTTPPRGDVNFFDATDTTEITSLALVDGRGNFLLNDDAIEVLRIFTETAAGEIGGRFKLGIRSAEPEFFAIEVLDTMLVADGVDEVTVYGRLLDVSGNPVLLPLVGVSFLLKETSTGDGAFTIPSVVTNADGEATTTMTATGAGILDVTAAVTWQNKELVILGKGETDFVPVTALPGPAAAIRLSLPADVVGFGEDLEVVAQLVDQFGNSVSESGYNVAFSSSPMDAGTLAPQFVDLDGTGRGVTVFTAGDSRDIVRISAVSTPSLPINDVSFIIDQITTISDPPFPEPDLDHQSLEAMDLTKVLVSNDVEALQFQIRFNTNWDGAHLVLLIEANNDAAGSTIDPFEFPVTYAHDLLPDYAFTFKYSSNDYADMRRWSGSEWEWWDAGGKTWIPTSGTWVEGINVQGVWTEKGSDWAVITVPYDFLEGNIPSTMRFQVYLTQDADIKRSAFDSAPHDSTLNLDFDPDNPDIDWSFAEQNIDLHHYSADYVIQGDFPPAPLLSNPMADPGEVDAGGTVTFTADVTDNGGGIGGVLIDLAPIGGSRYQFMYDDATNGDQSAGDGTYSYLHLVDPGIASGPYDLVVSARDSMNISGIDSTLSLTVQGTIEPIRILTDELNDDFGPNQFGREGLYYLYPTNQVFAKRAFDVESMTIFETSKIVAGEIIPSLAFEVKMGQVPDPSLEGNANWNPPYADINIQKIDIMIDAFKGGATEGLPNRQNDFASWDAWDYAIVMEGWYKAILTSNNQNTPSAWSQTVAKSDRDIILLTDFINNTITGVVSMESLGNPTADDILKWDITVVMTSHDGNSDDNNFGDTRWVNASVSEWQIGGGDNSDRDPNIMDLMLSPGTGKTAGRTQSEMLDWKTAESSDRVNNGLTPCYIDMTTFEDQGPPAIDVGDKVSETVPFQPLVNAPLYYTAIVVDDDQVAGSVFRWRPDSTTTDTWFEELDMGYAGDDIWSVDLPVEDMLNYVILAPLDSTWNIEFEIEAVDRSGNVTITPLQTMEINLPIETFVVSDIDMNEDFEVRAPEGTLIKIPTTAVQQDALDVRYNFKLTSEYADEFEPEPPGATPVNVYRKIEFEAVFSMVDEGGDTVDVTVPVPEFEDKISISFHYPQYSISNIDEDLIGVYEYTETTGIWVYIGGTVNPYGNLITVDVSRPGTYALLYNPEFKYNPGEVFSGVVFSPNPFSPNGDGLYEETEISFYLQTEATVTIEIYDMDGNRKRILERKFSITAEDTPDAVPRRVTGFTWDGRDNSGYLVSYGIYICRFTVTYQQAAGQRTIRYNDAVAVIR